MTAERTTDSARTGPRGPVLDICGLTVTRPDGHPVIDQISLRAAAGQRVAIVGESGAGKTTLALAALGILRAGLRRSAGTVTLAGRDVLALREGTRRRLRRAETAWLGQDPAGALTPTLPVAAQLTELLPRQPGQLDDITGRLAAVGLPTDLPFRRRLPHQLSGGQQQRLALARALSATPQLLVLDEPTSRLDPVTRALVLDEIDRRQRQDGFAILLISHDLDLVVRLADHLLVLQDGRPVEAGPTGPLLRHPAHPYTRRLCAAQPDPDRPRSLQEPPAAPTTPGRPAEPARMGLVVENLCAGYGTQPVLHEVELHLTPGRVLALVGSSGSGKSTLARCVTGLHLPSSGRVELDGQILAGRASDRSRDQRGRLQLIGPDPAGALHPRRRIGATVARPARLLHGLSRAAARTRAEELLGLVGLPAELRTRLPHQLSGGERQRVAIARALAADPRILVCDEITSALDATVAADVLQVLAELRRHRGLAVLFITHDLALAARSADTVTVLDHGRVVESGPTAAVLERPQSLSAAAMVAATPALRRTLRAGEPPTDAAEPADPTATSWPDPVQDLEGTPA